MFGKRGVAVISYILVVLLAITLISLSIKYGVPILERNQELSEMRSVVGGFESLSSNVDTIAVGGSGAARTQSFNVEDGVLTSYPELNGFKYTLITEGGECDSPFQYEQRIYPVINEPEHLSEYDDLHKGSITVDGRQYDFYVSSPGDSSTKLFVDSDEDGVQEVFNREDVISLGSSYLTPNLVLSDLIRFTSLSQKEENLYAVCYDMGESNKYVIRLHFDFAFSGEKYCKSSCEVTVRNREGVIHVS